MIEVADQVAQLAGVAKVRGEIWTERHRKPMSLDVARDLVRDIASNAELLERLAELAHQAAADALANPRPRPGGVSFKVGR
jgi:hypothetical protein